MSGVFRPTEEAALAVVYAEQKLARLKTHPPIRQLMWLMRMSGWQSAEIGRLMGRTQQNASWHYNTVNRALLDDETD